MTLDVYADVACPWCSIGKAHLKAALDARLDLSPEVRWRPFQLQPSIPPEGLPMRPFFTDKFGGEEQMAAAFGHVARAGEASGVRFDFSKLSGVSNTRDAHRVVLLAQEAGRMWEVSRALFDGYFAEGREVGDAETLADLASGAGLPPEAVLEMLASDRFVSDVQASQTKAAQLGIRGVPMVVINGQYGVSGAQPPEAFARAFEQIAPEAA